MALNQNPSIVTNGLVFYYDMFNRRKSWIGEPTTNQFAIPTPDSNGNVAFAVQGTGTFKRIFAGSFGGYDIQPSDIVYRYDLGTNGCHYHGNDVTISSGQYPTFTFDYYLSQDVTSFGDTFMANFENLGSGVSGSAGLPNLQKGVWQTIQINGSIATATSGLRMLLYPGGCSGGRLAATGFLLMKNPQVTFSSTSSKVMPFVAGTRYANSNLESSPSYPTWNQNAGSTASAGTLTFAAGSYNSKGGWDLYKTYSGLSTGTNYTWSALVKLGTASNLIITMNNTQAWNTGPSTVVAGLSSTDWTRVYITGTTDTGSFNLHLGASFNTEVASTVQSGGTVFIQDVRLVLSNSQTAISDLMDQNTITASSLTYESDGTFSFNGNNNNFIDGGNNTGALNITQPTICVWVRRTSYNSSSPMIIRRNDRDAYSLQVGQSNDTIWFKIYHGSSSWTSTPTSTIPLNTWCHFCGVFNGSQVLLYKNGQLVQSASTTSPISYGESTIPQLIIGRDDAVSGRYWHGSIPNVQIYNRPLSAAEIQQNFNAQRGIYGI